MMNYEKVKTAAPDTIARCPRCGQDMVSWTITLDGLMCIQCLSTELDAREEEQVLWLRVAVLSTGVVTLLGVAALALLW
jgi:transcription elongation factor Elf1